MTILPGVFCLVYVPCMPGYLGGYCLPVYLFGEVVLQCRHTM